MSQRDGHRVGRILGRTGSQSEKPGHHEDDLRFFGPTGSDDRFLDVRRCVVCDLDRTGAENGENHTAGLSENKG